MPLNEEAGYKREGNSPNFRDFSRLATATNIVLPLYKPKNSLNFFYNTLNTPDNIMHHILFIKTRVLNNNSETVTKGKWKRRNGCLLGLLISSETGKTQCICRQ